MSWDKRKVEVIKGNHHHVRTQRSLQGSSIRAQHVQHRLLILSQMKTLRNYLIHYRYFLANKSSKLIIHNKTTLRYTSIIYASLIFTHAYCSVKMNSTLKFYLRNDSAILLQALNVLWPGKGHFSGNCSYWTSTHTVTAFW